MFERMFKRAPFITQASRFLKFAIITYFVHRCFTACKVHTRLGSHPTFCVVSVTKRLRFVLHCRNMPSKRLPSGNNCCISRCRRNTAYDKAILWRRFPKDPLTRKLWVDAIVQNTELTVSWEPRKRDIICGCHFCSNGQRGYMYKLLRFLAPGAPVPFPSRGEVIVKT